MDFNAIFDFISSIAPGSATLIGNFMAAVVALLAFSIPMRNYLDERDSKLLDKNLDIRKKLGEKISNHELEQVIRFQLNRYSSKQFDRYKNQKWVRGSVFLLEILASILLVFSISSFQGGYLSVGFLALVTVLALFVFDAFIFVCRFKGILDKTKYVASLIRGTCKGRNLLIEERVLNSGHDREIGYRFIFIHDADNHKIYAYTKSKTEPIRKIRRHSLFVHPYFRSHELMNVTYEYAWQANADSAYRVTNSYPVISQGKALDSKYKIEEKEGKLWLN